MSRSPSRHGLTLIELTLALVILGLMMMIATRQVTLFVDRIATRDAVRAAAAVVARARDEALALHTPVSIRIDTTRDALELVTRSGLIARAMLGDVHGVSLTTTRDSITFDVRGLGYGAANLTLVAKRGRSADTMVVSRLGRVR